MTSSKPYLIRALYEWIADNGLTPYLLVNAEYSNTVVPREFVEDGKIVLNISASAVKFLELGNELIEFEARFSGQPMAISVPVAAALALYARENGKGMVFSDEDGGDEPPPEPKDDSGSSRPALRVVK